MQLTISITGDAEILHKLKRLGASIIDFEDEFKGLGETLADYFASTGFTDQGAPFGTAWAPLAQSTKVYKEKHFAGKPALVRTGAMQRGFYYKASSNQLLIDNAVKYFKYHQSTKPRRISPETGKLLLPRRPMMGINLGIKRTIQGQLEEGVRRKIDGVRL
jgi:hypothetical protein